MDDLLQQSGVKLLQFGHVHIPSHYRAYTGAAAACASYFLLLPLLLVDSTRNAQPGWQAVDCWVVFFY